MIIHVSQQTVYINILLYFNMIDILKLYKCSITFRMVQAYKNRIFLKLELEYSTDGFPSVHEMECFIDFF